MFLEERGQSFVLAVKKDEPLWALGGRGPAQASAREIVEGAAPEDFERLSAGDGSKGPWIHD